MDTYLEGRPFGLFAVGMMLSIILAYIIYRSYRRHLAFDQLAKAMRHDRGFVQDCIMEIKRLNGLNEAAMNTFEGLCSPENPLDELMFRLKLTSMYWESEAMTLNLILDRIADIGYTLDCKTQLILFNSMTRWNTPMQRHYISKLLSECPGGTDLAISIRRPSNWLKRLYFRFRQIFIDQWISPTFLISRSGAPRSGQPIPS